MKARRYPIGGEKPMLIRKKDALELPVFICLGFLVLASCSPLQGKEPTLPKAVFFVS
jgi:hypothetical protein